MAQDRRPGAGEPTVPAAMPGAMTGSRDEEPVEQGETQWVLVVLRHGAIEEHTLPPRGELRVGRDDDAEISIGHRSVSRHHATIVIEGGAVSVTDAAKTQTRNKIHVGSSDNARSCPRSAR